MREYSLELVREIAEQVGDGKLKLIDVCNSDTRFPPKRYSSRAARPSRGRAGVDRGLDGPQQPAQ